LTGDSPGDALGRLRELLNPRPRTPLEERCELCGVPIPPEHRHLVNLETRSLLCVCRPCGLLFVSGGAAGGKYRTVPERHLFARDLVKVLLHAHNERKFTKLCLVASPEFLGVLRRVLTPQLEALVSREINKDYTQLGAAELRERIRTLH